MNSKVGLLSTQFTINYGAVLQAYSLFKNVEKINNGNVEVIDYRPDHPRYGHQEIYGFNSLKNIIFSSSKILNIKYRANRKNKKNGFKNFIDNEIKFTKKQYSSNVELHDEQFDFDTIITGSDQVWNPRVIKDSSFYLDFVNDGINKVSYAASIGDELCDNDLFKLCESIKSFKKVSLREPLQIDIISSNINNEVSVNIDPVFLTDKEDWKELSKKSKLSIHEDYILIYEVNSPDNFRSYVDYLKKKSDIKVIELSTRSIPKYLNVDNIGDASPYDFLYLFSNAKYVLTSSFHGVAFSSLLNIPFSCALGSTRGSRQKNILSKLKLQDCIVTNTEELESNIKNSYNWDDVNNRIEIIKRDSIQYINEALS
ncbi:polysaccharide pyruvyl transferase family protein [Vibrio crassostreae]|uniref:polysaccharide pyruvyl transferase family protein n=1 Tax=Vibrio crassostreae TaxID=246167 RepID=UPI0002D2F04D|nr:polysaccharide pyruvyl transferase family protein [Vibrio crassostreae]OED89945.1 hypothetical protein A141_13525 [Vibrio crassostreae ZF-91]